MKKSDIKVILEKVFSDFDIQIHKILLFGSRARADYSHWSDYDVLVVTENELSIETKKKISKTARLIFAQKNIDLDILIINLKKFTQSKYRTGSIIKQAQKEGVLL